jgi:hypothetical protein
MSDQPPLAFPFSNFNIFPMTDWERFFNPQFFITVNGDDAHVENQVLRSAGSYGKQIGRMMTVVNILLEHVPLENLSEQDRGDIAKFRATSIAVDDIVSTAKGRPRRDFAPVDIEAAVDALRALKQTDPTAYQRLAAKFADVLKEAPPSAT